jgi:hypothetical protein
LPDRASPWRRLALVALAVLAAALARARAVRELPPDYDELDYIPAGFEYARRMEAGRWREIPGVKRNAEHPALVKLLHGVVLRAAGAAEPDASKLAVGKPMPDAARPAFLWTRALSAVAGVAQVLLVALVSGVGGLWLALDTYHVKYTSQAMLEAIPGLLALLAVLLFERATRREPGPDGAPATDRIEPRAALLVLSSAALGLSAAGKYPYPLVTGAALAPFLAVRLRRHPGALVLYPLAAILFFWAGNPAIWDDPLGRTWASLTYHWSFSSGAYVKRAGLPWWWQLHWLTRPAPAGWHPGVFRVTFLDYALLAVGLASFPVAVRRRPVWAAWTLAGLAFLLVWPTKWPQYTLVVRVPLAGMAGLGLSAAWEWVRRRPGRQARPPLSDPGG